MKTVYITKSGLVKSGYTIRIRGRVLRVRMTHIEILNFLRNLRNSWRAA